MKKTILACSIASMSLTGMAFGQVSATVTTKSGQTMAVQVVDLGAGGFAVRADGQDRQMPTNEVAAIDFTGGTVASADWDKLSGGGQILMLKSGENITGQLTDIGGTSPLRLTFRTASGERDFSSNDVARIVMSRPDNAATPGPTTGNTGSTSAQGVTVSSQMQWTPTGIAVRRGEWVSFSTTGDVKIGGEGNPTANADGLTTGARAPDSPVAAAPAGALVGKIGNGAAFVIGSRNRVQMTAAGQLFLGVNDGHLQDNEGAFQVQVAREAGTSRR
ncbi:MAG: hypothetical protein ABIX28_19200 [Vicinamibacterales bacterium]